MQLSCPNVICGSFAGRERKGGITRGDELRAETVPSQIISC
jgi:hypothetical protein